MVSFKKYNILLFDFDCTLVDSTQGIVMCFQHVLQKHGYGRVTDEDIKRTIGKTLEESFTILSSITDEAVLKKFRAEYVQQADICMTSHTCFFPEVATTLKALKSQRMKLGIISTKYRYRIHEFVDTALGADFFDVIVGGEDVHFPKPHPEGVLLALQQSRGEKRHCLYLGDSTVDAQTAMAAKVDFVGVLHGVTTREELELYPHVGMTDNLEILLKD